MTTRRKPWTGQMPPNADIWLMFNEDKSLQPFGDSYCHWYDTQEQALGDKRHLKRMNREVSVPVQCVCGTRKGRKALWLLFDLSNTNAGTHGYAWWFGTRQEARKHRAWQMSSPDNAPLSAPVRYSQVDK